MGTGLPAEPAWEPQHKGSAYSFMAVPHGAQAHTTHSRQFLLEPGRKMLRTGLASERAASLRHTDLNLLPLPRPLSPVKHKPRRTSGGQQHLLPLPPPPRAQEKTYSPGGGGARASDGFTLRSKVPPQLLTAESRSLFLCREAKASCGLFPVSDPPLRLHLSFSLLVLPQIWGWHTTAGWGLNPPSARRCGPSLVVHLLTDRLWCFRVFTRAGSSSGNRPSTARKA